MTMQEAGKKVLANVQKEHNYITTVSLILVCRADGLYLLPGTGRGNEGNTTEFYRFIKTERQYALDYEVKL